MAQQYTRFLNILKKWPIEEPRKSHCLGKYLRDTSSKWFTPDGRVIGSHDECEQRLQSIERLSSDYYKQKYPSRIASVSERTLEECTADLIDIYKERKGILTQMKSKIFGQDSKK